MGDGSASRISGLWYNQLGSRVEFVTDEEGSITGSVHSSVGGVPGSHPLTGYFDPNPGDGRGALGFVVRWPPTHSVTVWAGHYELDRDVILATWLLTGGPFTRDEWRSTLVGHDIFVREPQPVDGTVDWASSIPTSVGSA